MSASLSAVCEMSEEKSSVPMLYVSLKTMSYPALERVFSHVFAISAPHPELGSQMATREESSGTCSSALRVPRTTSRLCGNGMNVQSAFVSTRFFS